MSLMHQSYEINENVPKWIVILRVVLGVSLILKAINFFNHSSDFQKYFDTGLLKNAGWLISVIPWIHLLGGILIVIGLFTRFASLVQIPILFGAVIFVNLKQGGASDLPFSILILVLVIAFTFVGGGYLSMDDTYRKPVLKD